MTASEFTAVTYPADPDWPQRGACRGRDTAMFFSPDGERSSARIRREQRAKQLCEACPVRIECREHALTTGEAYGIWGGMTENDRARHLRRARTQRRRGPEQHPHGRVHHPGRADRTTP